MRTWHTALSLLACLAFFSCSSGPGSASEDVSPAAKGIGDGEFGSRPATGDTATGDMASGPTSGAPVLAPAAGGGASAYAGESGSAGSASIGGSTGMGGSYATADAGVPDAQPIDAAAFPDGGASPSSRHTLSTATSGLLTAGAWDDNRNFIRFTRYRAGIVETLPGAPPFTVTEHEQALSLFNPQPPPRQVLDVSLVIDTTGSMSDELGYLQNEFLAITTTIAQRYPNAQQRWSVVLYRDYGDEYVTRWFDFRSDLTEFQTHLAAQSASGGGDMPEQPDKALGTMAQLAWRSGTGVAKLAFWVGDAPHHDENAASMAGAVRASAAQGIHIYPVAGSGIDPLGELTMRSAAQLTGGRYLFLTSDSGVGGAHAEPTIPCYFVTKLNEAILRMVDVEMTGVYHEPNPEEVIRTGGNPEDGACHLSSGEQVQPF